MILNPILSHVEFHEMHEGEQQSLQVTSPGSGQGVFVLFQIWLCIRNLGHFRVQAVRLIGFVLESVVKATTMDSRNRLQIDSFFK